MHAESPAKHLEKGERDGHLVGPALERLRPYGFEALHDVHLPGRPRPGVDHVVVGPPGVFVMNTENWSGTVTVEAETLRQNGYSRVQQTEAVHRSALVVGLSLGAAWAAFVVPVICLIGDAELLAAVKYVPLEELGVLAEAGVTLLGENRAQDLVAKAEAYPGVFRWHFIGQLQSRKVKDIVPRVRLIHSLCTDSALGQLANHAPAETQVLIQVNVAGEEAKSGIVPGELGAFIERCPVRVAGLMTMPPFATDPEASRPHFARLAELAAAHGLAELSMGTSQDWRVAVEEGATIIRLGTALLQAGNGA